MAGRRANKLAELREVLSALTDSSRTNLVRNFWSGPTKQDMVEQRFLIPLSDAMHALFQLHLYGCRHLTKAPIAFFIAKTLSGYHKHVPTKSQRSQSLLSSLFPFLWSLE